VVRAARAAGRRLRRRGHSLVGTLTDVTEFKTAEERLLHDAVHDNLTGLPNRELFLDRLEAVLGFAKTDARSARP
jgi:PleD family two-component response regulator